MNEGIDDKFNVGEGGHETLRDFKKLNDTLSYNLKLRVLEGRFSPEPQDIPMLKAFKKTKLLPKTVLKRWRG